MFDMARLPGVLQEQSGPYNRYGRIISPRYVGMCAL